MARDKISGNIRRVVAARAKGYCEYCRCPERLATESFTVEHIIPYSLDGGSTLDNLAWSCFGCNSFKHVKTQALDPETGEQVNLFNPRQQLWQENFAWSRDGTRIIGKTSIGRATIEAMKLNRAGLVNLRQVLVEVGLHPPQED